MLSTLVRLRDAGRRDIIALIADSRLSLAEVHDFGLTDLNALNARIASAESHRLKPLVEEWFDWLRSAHALAPRTKRPYAANTVRRYEQSWSRIFRVLPRRTEATMADITKGFLADYRKRRKAEGRSGATINRDIVTIQSFWRWCEQEREIPVQRVRIDKEREADGRDRWLDSQELERLHSATPANWWPLFALLFHTGMRIGEAQGLVWGDVRLAHGYIEINTRVRRLKTTSSSRNVPTTNSLAAILADLARGVPNGPADPVFCGPLASYRRARSAFRKAIKQASLRDATIHDLRHTYGVHCAQAGVPLPRLQQLMGHASPVMTMRYMKHSPQNYFLEDAALLEASLSGPVSAGPTPSRHQTTLVRSA